MESFVCEKPAQAAGAAREIKALQFSKIVLVALFSIAYHFVVREDAADDERNDDGIDHD